MRGSLCCAFSGNRIEVLIRGHPDRTVRPSSEMLRAPPAGVCAFSDAPDAVGHRRRARRRRDAAVEAIDRRQGTPRGRACSRRGTVSCTTRTETRATKGRARSSFAGPEGQRLDAARPDDPVGPVIRPSESNRLGRRAGRVAWNADLNAPQTGHADDRPRRRAGKPAAPPRRAGCGKITHHRGPCPRQSDPDHHQGRRRQGEVEHARGPIGRRSSAPGKSWCSSSMNASP